MRPWSPAPAPTRVRDGLIRWSLILAAALVFAPVRGQVTPPAVGQDHLRLQISVDLDDEVLTGRATYTLIARRDSLATLAFRVGGLHIDQVGASAPGSPPGAVPYLRSGDSLLVRLDGLPLRADVVFLVEIAYTAPLGSGLLRRAVPERTVPFLWTSADRMREASWFPRLDLDLDKLTTELVVDGPAGMRVLGPGSQLFERTGELRSTTHNVQDQPHAARQLAFAAGPFEIVQRQVPLTNGRTLPLVVAVPPGRTSDVDRSIAALPGLIDAYARYFGIVYPWPALRLAFVPGLSMDIVDGTGLLIFDDGFLLDERARGDRADALALAVALARQWTDHVVTPPSGTDAWLHDGLARLAALDATRPTYADEAARTIRDDLLPCAAQPLAQPLAGDPPAELSRNAAIYACRSGLALHHVAQRAGEVTFADGLRRFMRRHAFWFAGADAFLAELDDRSGTAQLGTLDSWLRRTDWPTASVRPTYDAAAEKLHLAITGAGHFPDTLATTLVLHSMTGADSLGFTVPPRHEVRTVPSTGRPRFAIADPDGRLPLRIAVEQTAPAWVAQLRYAPDPRHRSHAAEQLRAFADDPALLIGLRDALGSETHPDVREAIVELIGALRPSPTASALLVGVCTDEAASVREAVQRALPAHPAHPEALACARDRARHDVAYDVQAAAVGALAALQAPDAVAIVRSALVTPSHREVIRQAALATIPQLPLGTAEARTLVLDHSRPDVPPRVRAAALRTLGRLEPHTSILERLNDALTDGDPHIRRAAIDGLVKAATPRARIILETHHSVEPDPDVRWYIAQALETE